MQFLVCTFDGGDKVHIVLGNVAYFYQDGIRTRFEFIGKAPGQWVTETVAEIVAMITKGKPKS